jgi:hypothetical protein
MDLQKMASEFAAAIMRVVQGATIEELTGLGEARRQVKWLQLKRKPFIPGANVVATVSALGTTLKMRALKKDIVKSTKKRAAKVAKKVVKKPTAKRPLKKAVKRSHKKKVSR